MENSSEQTLQQLMFSLIELWKSGDKSQQEFCKEKDLDYNRFQYWFRKYRALTSSSTSDTKFFRQIKAKEFTATKCTVELVYPDGKKIIFHQPVDASFLRMLLS